MTEKQEKFLLDRGFNKMYHRHWSKYETLVFEDKEIDRLINIYYGNLMFGNEDYFIQVRENRVDVIPRQICDFKFIKNYLTPRKEKIEEILKEI